MINFPYCKINLGLHVLNKRDDGYHNIETCFFPIPWNDVLEIIPSQATAFFLTGIKIPGAELTNIVLKAYQLLKRDFSMGDVEIHLHKIIPTGAGLGGGSSDGAHALQLLNNLFGLGLSKEKLRGYAFQLGSDCPFFLEPTPMLATGRGELLKPAHVNLSGFTLVIVKPDWHVSTAAAYAGVNTRLLESIRQKNYPSIEQTLQESVANWKSWLKNDFEESVFNIHPPIAEVKNKLYRLGAVYASMSGSGSAVYGLFASDQDIEKEFSGMVCWKVRL